MESVVEADDVLPASVGPRNLDRVVDRLTSTVGKEQAAIPQRRREEGEEAVQEAGERDRTRKQVLLGVDLAASLGSDSRGNNGMHVARADDANTGSKVEQGAAVGGGDAAAGRGVGDEVLLG